MLRDQRLMMAAAVAGQMAHDFNNLLAPLITYAELLKMQLPDGHPGVEHCDAIIEITDQMAATISSTRTEPK